MKGGVVNETNLDGMGREIQPIDPLLADADGAFDAGPSGQMTHSVEAGGTLGLPTTTFAEVAWAIATGDPVPDGDIIMTEEEADALDRIRQVGPPQWVKDL
jgi:hypothetical protein